MEDKPALKRDRAFGLSRARRVLAGAALALAMGTGGAMAQVALEVKALEVPAEVAPLMQEWTVGTWSVDRVEGCFWAYFSCYETQETYNAGIEPKYPLPLNEEARAFHDKVVAALGEGRSIFDPNSQCYPSGMPDRAFSGFKFVPGPAGDRIYLILGGNDFRTIWMDGREMPKRQPHEYTYNGDSIGHWEGNTLVIETRNITGPNTAISPNEPKSDNFWVIERWTPVSADKLSSEVTFKDEDRFTDTYTETFTFTRNPKGETGPQPRACIPGEGQRYFAADDGTLLLTGPGGAPLEKAED